MKKYQKQVKWVLSSNIVVNEILYSIKMSENTLKFDNITVNKKASNLFKFNKLNSNIWQT